MVDVDEFYHVDPEGITDINEFGKIKPALARFVVEKEGFGFPEAS
ncbi:hypothetical protein [Pandoraea horticolens]|nr:hypothetical protein [Pandoraea horticolens]